MSLDVIYSTKNISAASGLTTFFEVPKGQRWTLVFLRKPTTTGSSYIALDSGEGCNIPLSDAGTGTAYTNCGIGWDLKPGTKIQMGNTNNGADTARQLTIIVDRHGAVAGFQPTLQAGRDSVSGV